MPEPGAEVQEQPKTATQRISSILAETPEFADPPAEQAPEAPEQPQEATQSVTEGQDVEEPKAAEPAPESPEQAETAEPAEEAVEIGTLDDLAQHLGVETADLYNLRLNITREGMPQEITLGEWKDGVLGTTQVQSKTTELAAEREQFEAEKASLRAQLEHRLTEAQALLEGTEKALLADMEAVKWDELRENDPSEWAAKRTEFAERQALLQRMKTEALEKYQAEQREQAGRFQEQMAKHLQREREALLAHPLFQHWRNPDVHKQERSELCSYLYSQGFTESEVDNAYDHRLIVMAAKSKKLDELEAKTKVNKKKVVKIGKKVLKPGTKPSRDETKRDAYNAARTKARKSGGVRDAAEAIKHII